MGSSADYRYAAAACILNNGEQRYVEDVISDVEQVAAKLSLSPTTPHEATLKDNDNIVLFDLETSGFGKAPEILQIGAMYQDKSFGIFVTPTKPIPTFASNVHGLRNVDGKLYRFEKHVPSVPLSQALIEFKNFLQQVPESCVLVAHNLRFDKPLILRALAKTNLWNEFENIISGFSDSLPIFRDVLQRKTDCNLGYLAREANIDAVNAHDAMADVIILQKLLKYHKISNDIILQKKQSLEDAIREEKANEQTSEFLKTLSPFDGVLSPGMKKKMALAKLNFEVLVQKYLDNGAEGLELLLSQESANGKPEVTKCRAVIDRVVDFVETFITNILQENHAFGAV